MHNEVAFHEDDYCQIELVARENFLLANQEINTITNSVRLKGEEDGFIEIHSRNQIKIPLRSKNIGYDELTEILSKDALSTFDTVFIGYSLKKELLRDTSAFAFENYAVFVSQDNHITQKIWIIYKKFSETLNIKPVKLEQTLHQIGINWRLLLVDWNELMIVNLEDNKQLDEYVSNI